MTRKRYCKLIMGQGHGRNVANHEAMAVCLRGETYAAHWGAVLLYEGLLGRECIATNSKLIGDSRRIVRYKRRYDLLAV